MLKRLHISNFTLIDKIDIELTKGLTCITGQTGAGKSILIGGLSLVLGKRAESDLLHDKTKKCVIEAEFESQSDEVSNFIGENDFDQSELVLLRRELLPSGKSRSFINDTPATLKQMNKLGEILIDIHAQHENLKLGEISYRLFVLDAFGQHLSLTEQYQTQFHKVNLLKKELANLEKEIQSKKNEQDYLQFLFDELEKASIVEGELIELEEKLKKLENAEEIKSVLFSANQIISNEANGISDLVSNLERTFQSIANYGDAYNSVYERVRSLNIEIQDLSGEIGNLESEVYVDGSELEVLQERVNLVNQLLNKHQVRTDSELLLIKTELEDKLGQISTGDSKVESLKSELIHESKLLEKLAGDLSQARLNCTAAFQNKLVDILKQLGMPEAKFQIDFDQKEECELNGKENANFMFTANKGVELKRVENAASGGELSRILLAIKSIVSSKTKLPTIVFDEIDTGVSGEVANKMGELMKVISKDIQVMSITHLPQIAAKGSAHWSVYKDHNADKTLTKIIRLEDDERVIELAKMLSGDKLSMVAKENARILLNN